jgi:hypothetical protein
MFYLSIDELRRSLQIANLAITPFKSRRAYCITFDACLSASAGLRLIKVDEEQKTSILEERRLVDRFFETAHIRGIERSRCCGGLCGGAGGGRMV